MGDIQVVAELPRTSSSWRFDYVSDAYIISNDTRQALARGQQRGQLEDLCQCVRSSPEDVYFGFCRELDGDKNYFALIAFVPTTVAGVRRGQ